MSEKNKILEDKIAESKLGGGKKRIDSQHEKGKLTARERIELLLDDESFEEIGGLVMHRSTPLPALKNIPYFSIRLEVSFCSIN